MEGQAIFFAGHLLCGLRELGAVLQVKLITQQSRASTAFREAMKKFPFA